MLKLVMIQAISGAILYPVGKEFNFADDEAVRLVKAGIAKPTNKKSYDAVLKKLEKNRIIQKEKEEQAAAILHKEELEGERSKLQVRVDEITHSLGDAADYYKSYAGLGGKDKTTILSIDDLIKKEDESIDIEASLKVLEEKLTPKNNKGEGK